METIKASLAEVTLSKEKNLMIVNGCIAFIDKPTNGAPCGSNGMNMVITSEAVETCGKTFKDMPVNCVMADGLFDLPQDILSGHGGSNIGFMRKIKSQDDRIMAEIVIWKDNLPWGMADMILNAVDSLGFSIEMYATRTHDDIINNIKYVDEFEGVGVALMWSNAAAFSDTFIEKIAAMKNKGGKNMDEVKLKEIIEASLGNFKNEFETKLNDVVGKLDKFEAAQQVQTEPLPQPDETKMAEMEAKMAEMAKANEELRKKMEEVKAEADKAQAELEKAQAELEKVQAQAAPIPVPQAVGTPAPNPNVGGTDEYQAQIDKINASNMPLERKIKEITKIRASKMKEAK